MGGGDAIAGLWWPYSAEGHGKRASALRILSDAAAGTGGTLRLSPDDRVTFDKSFHVDRALTPQALMAGLVPVVLGVRQYPGVYLDAVGAPDGAVSSSPAA